MCGSCNTIHYTNPKIVVGCIPEWEDTILLCRRAIEPRYGFWTLPAGFLEDYETTIEGAARETREEALADVEISELYTLINLPQINQVYVIFRGALREREFGPGEESLDVRLCREEDIPWDPDRLPGGGPDPEALLQGPPARALRHLRRRHHPSRGQVEGLPGALLERCGCVMLRAIQRFFDGRIDPGHRDVRQSDQHRLQVATGALLIEMMRTDVEVTEGERPTVVVAALQEKFDLTPEETHDLVELAEAEADDSIDHYQFTSLIKTGFSEEQKRKVVEYLWAVAYADENADEHEGVPGPQDRQPHRRAAQGIHRGEAAGAGGGRRGDLRR